MRYAVTICLFAACLNAAAQENSLSSRVDAIFQEYRSLDTPGCAVGIISNGEYIHMRGYGAANLEHRIAIGPNSVFRIGSVSKQFTAAAIAILATRGELDLDADIHSYLPELRDFESTVTIRQMVHHISGMGNYDGGYYEISDGKPFRFGNEDYWTIDEFYARAIQQPLALPPGERYEYSNIAYFLLGQVVERVSGRTLRTYAEQEMFKPLGMDATFFNDNVDGIVRNRADGYRPIDGGGFEIFMTNLDWVGDGGLYTTLNDFIKWDQAFLKKLPPIDAQVQSLMLHPHPTTVDTMDDGLLDEGGGYGFGLDVGEYQGRSVHMHGGSWVGFRAFYARFPDDDFSLILMCNRSDAQARGRYQRLLDLVVAELLK